MFKANVVSFFLISSILISSCSQETAKQNKGSNSETKTSENIAPEDNPNLKGTPILGFKMRDSTVESVQKRLENYKNSDGESYAGGPILENDGSGFNIDGLEYTQFGFDKNKKLVYVWMSIKENNHMSQETYIKIVNYVKKIIMQLLKKSLLLWVIEK